MTAGNALRHIAYRFVVLAAGTVAVFGGKKGTRRAAEMIVADYGTYCDIKYRIGRQGLNAVRDLVEAQGWRKLARDEARITAAAFWICDNIEYNASDTPGVRKNARHVLMRRKGDCTGQAYLFRLIMQELGIRCDQVALFACAEGGTRIPAEYIDEWTFPRHSVCIVPYDGGYRYVDTTYFTEMPVRTMQDFLLNKDYANEWVTVEGMVRWRYSCTKRTSRKYGLDLQNLSL